MKDMRASCFERVNVISRYKVPGRAWGITKARGTRRPISSSITCPKARFVFEYPLFVTHAGDFSNGVTTIQCMYAPEFTSHSEGIRRDGRGLKNKSGSRLR